MHLLADGPMPNRRPAVSVIIPLYNKRQTIKRAIASVLSQYPDDLELIVVDDGSTDGSERVVRACHDPRIRLFQQTNQGPGKARNVGASLARGEYLAFLDADDEWVGDFVATAKRALAGNPSCIAYVCGYDSGPFRHIRPNLVHKLGLKSGPFTLPMDLAGPALKRHVDAMASGCVAIRAGIFKELGGFYERDGCRYGEDSFLWLQALFRGPIYWDPAELARIHLEDSDLGYATTRRQRARPVSVEFEALLSSCPVAYRGSLLRAVRTFAELDGVILRKSGAFKQAAELRRIHNAEMWGAPLRDYCSYARARFRDITRALP